MLGVIENELSHKNMYLYNEWHTARLMNDWTNEYRVNYWGL